MRPDTSGVVGDLTVALLAIINSGAVVRFMLIMIHLSHSDDDIPSYKKKIKNLLIFVIVANTITGILATILSYFA